MNSSQFQDLIDRYISDQCTEEEIKTLQQLLKDPVYSASLEQIMDQQLTASTAIEADYSEVVSRLKKSIEQKIGQEQPATAVRRLPLFRRWAAAAAILIFVGSIVFWQIARQQASKQGGTVSSTPSFKQEFTPGKEGAILTLEDGRTIVLDSLGNGLVTDQNGAKVLLTNGQLAYKTDNTNAATVSYNTMTTPKGRQFSLLLQDGTKVWLNAASSLRYPTAFTGSERTVEITGEAYFEVAKNANMPFRVKVNNETTIEVLGTHFNINSYPNETSINTTLLEGSVKVIHGSEKAIIKPGQQAQVSGQSQSHITVVADVNVERVMAWKNGVFDFQDASLREVMRQLERWYDIEVVYEKNVPELEFMGKMGRDLTLSEVLRGLEMSEVHFRIQEGKLIVTP